MIERLLKGLVALVLLALVCGCGSVTDPRPAPPPGYELPQPRVDVAPLPEERGAKLERGVRK